MVKLGLFDADHVSYIACHNKKDAKIKTLEQVYHDIDDYISNVFRDTKITHYIGALSKGKGFRFTVNPKYKANRDYSQPMNFLQESKQYMIDKWKFIYNEGLEADDIVEICYNYYSEESTITIEYNPIRISTDKDILNLQGLNYGPRNKKFYEISEEQALDYFWKSMITGDAIDGIKGLPKRGIKYAEKLFEENLGTPIESLVFNEYIQLFGESKGIEEFYKNYKCLKILEVYEGFNVPTLLSVNNREEIELK